ncbi:4Fe-4S ferredoxin [Prosthecochloris sp. GSB1]|uniref:4Fe-4S dicluster domain-containing protein n=1 Tax=Prosthecochloris sp. GSB1 TaxID=281093 RepID=UPI000B8CE929|nr:4Fe-4S dicluster domain-containing protein [Prosthecochloris sp. GSB1]ASQ89580.1 4Fe-4S ferredoxin [Prosthecochloris sp. GSB1]
MNYGFVIDGRKCIGCHACTVACKSENEVPLGVNRTWVKYVEKGKFPDTRRYFTVLRCNHCQDPPCVDICPVEALQKREDGIVDFDGRRCIGCKACGQACPYGALYIDPETHTSAKCNYCAHRNEIGMKPACVVTCPQQAIVSGDLDDPESEIAKLVATQQTMVRKPEKGTSPNLFYINGDGASLDPMQSGAGSSYLWSEQSRGVGHFAGKDGKGVPPKSKPAPKGAKPPAVRKVYDAPSKGVVWGWEVPAYIWSKGISSGVFMLLFAFTSLFALPLSDLFQWSSWGVSLAFLGLTGGFLIRDLDRPDRFSSVMLRPQFKSWLVRGGYTITGFGGLLALWGIAKFLGVEGLRQASLWGGALFALLTSVYTAFLFSAAKGRDFWQSPLLALHMLVTSLLAGGSAMIILAGFSGADGSLQGALRWGLVAGLIVDSLIIFSELYGRHPSKQAGETAHVITHGSLRQQFWIGCMLAGHLLPFVLLLATPSPLTGGLAAILALGGVYYTEKLWIKAPQLISLS